MDIDNVTEVINSSINSLYSSFLNSINVDSYEILDEITFIDSKILDNTYFISFLDNHSHSIIDIANALLLAFLIYYGFSYLFSHLSGKYSVRFLGYYPTVNYTFQNRFHSLIAILVLPKKSAFTDRSVFKLFNKIDNTA